jgi:hypothetical protein
MSGVVARELETVSGTQFNDGLSIVNDILGDKRIEKGMIPYFTPIDFTSLTGQESYWFPGLNEVTTITFFLNEVRYYMTPMDRDAWFGNSKALNIESLPGYFHVERGFNTNPIIGPIGSGATVYVYFLPSQNFPMEIWGKSDIPFVTLGLDLETRFDRFYINYMKYKTTERICHEYDYDTPDDIQSQLEKYDRLINKVSAKLDLTVNIVSSLSEKDQILNYAQANLGRGFFPN